VVVVLDGALALRNLPGMREVLRDGPQAGVYVIGADAHGMNEYRGLCQVDAGSAQLTRTPAEPPIAVRPETITAAAAERVVRSLAPMARYDGEIDQYWRARRSRPDLPRLVMIFDEFARVLETSPDFLKELVNVAAKGRSLGMDLVLATQSLQGKLSPELKNNISLRISLPQNEPADSTEVLGVATSRPTPGTVSATVWFLRTCPLLTRQPEAGEAKRHRGRQMMNARPAGPAPG
jgi:hypothetical protein